MLQQARTTVRYRTRATSDGGTRRQVLITPEVAAYLLAQNTNRRTSPTFVSMYARQMLDGAWRHDDEETTPLGLTAPIEEVIAGRGSMTSGGHRVAAVLQCGGDPRHGGIWMWFSLCGDSTSAWIANTNRAEPASSVLRRMHIPYPRSLARLCLNICMLVRDAEWYDFSHVGSQRPRLTPEEVMKMSDSDSGIMYAAGWTERSCKGPRLYRAPTAEVLVWMAWHSKVVEEMDALLGAIHRADGSAGVAAHIASQKLTLERRRAGRAQVNPRIEAEYIARAWNHYIRNPQHSLRCLPIQNSVPELDRIQPFSVPRHIRLPAGVRP